MKTQTEQADSIQAHALGVRARCDMCQLHEVHQMYDADTMRELERQIADLQEQLGAARRRRDILLLVLFGIGIFAAYLAGRG